MTDMLIGMQAAEAEKLLTDKGIRFVMVDYSDRKTNTDGQRRVARVRNGSDGLLEVVCMYFHNDIYGA